MESLGSEAKDVDDDDANDDDDDAKGAFLSTETTSLYGSRIDKLVEAFEESLPPPPWS